MKKRCFIFIAVLSVLFSCQIDKSGIPKVNNNTTLDGTWYLKAKDIVVITNGAAANSYTLTNFNRNDYYKFNSDNTVNFLDVSNAYTSYYSLLTTQNTQTLTIGSAPGYPGAAYTVNKLTQDSLILYNSVTAADTEESSVTNTTYKYAH